ncbi:MAG: hypothetical protein ACRC2K_03110 [Clostridium sp.]
MNKKHRMILLVILGIIFIPLSYIKLTTAAIQVKDDATFTIAKSPSINWIGNYYSYDIENPEGVKDTWYYNKNYEIIHADEVTGPARGRYNLLITSWWIIGAIIIYNTIRLLKKHPKAELN